MEEVLEKLCTTDLCYTFRTPTDHKHRMDVAHQEKQHFLTLLLCIINHKINQSNYACIVILATHSINNIFIITIYQTWNAESPPSIVMPIMYVWPWWYNDTVWCVQSSWWPAQHPPANGNLRGARGCSEQHSCTRAPWARRGAQGGVAPLQVLPAGRKGECIVRKIWK